VAGEGIGVHLIDVHLMGVHLTGVYLIGMYLTGVHISRACISYCGVELPTIYQIWLSNTTAVYVCFLPVRLAS
jgi:hypothetical protein